MAENKNVNLDYKALKFYGKAYLKVPRIIIEQLFSRKKKLRTRAQIHWCLFMSCNYADGHVRIKGKRVYCNKGEYLSTYMDLAKKIGVSDRTVRRYVEELVEESLLEVTPCDKYTCFRVRGYEEYTAHDEPKPKKEKVKDNDAPAVKSRSAVLAERRAEEEQNISHGNKPRTDLLNYS